MALASADLARLLISGQPILCIDTCSILDIVRDPSRDTSYATHVTAASELIRRMEAQSTLICLIAPQVKRELGDNLKKVEEEAQKGIDRTIKQIKNIDAIAKVFQSSNRLDISHFDGHISRARAYVDRLIAAGIEVQQSDEIATRALTRCHVDVRTPAQKGKDSSKDCVIIETYLEAVTELRAAGFGSKIVFLSSNTDDYARRPNHDLNEDLKAEFEALTIEYAMNASLAKHLLGFSGNSGTT